MLNFDEARYLRIQGGAVGLAGSLTQAVQASLRAGADSLFFLGTGGAAILMQPAAWLLSRHSKLDVVCDLSAELVLAGHPRLGPNSIVVIPSLSGTTKESIEALRFCRDAGATVMTLVGHAGTPLHAEASSSFVNFAEDDTSCESFYIQSLLIALGAMNGRGEFPALDRVVAELALLPGLLVEAKRSFEGRAAAVAETIAASPYHIISGAGMVWPQAFYYGMCILEEMQWIRTRPVHASDFFHGTLELIEKDTSLLLLKGEDAARPLADRVEAFAQRYSERVTVLDTRDVALPGLSDDTRAMVSPLVLSALLERVSAHLEVRRNHPLTTRRYYKKVAY